MFSSIGAEHATRRRRFANIYAKSSVQSSPHVRQILSTLLLKHYMPAIDGSVGTTINVLDINFGYSLDFVTAFIFGISRSANFIQDAAARNSWLASYAQSHPTDYSFWLLEMPGLTKLLAKIGIHLVPSWNQKGHHDLEKWTLEKLDATDRAIEERPAEEMQPGDCPVIYCQLKLAMANEQEHTEPKSRLTPPSEQRLELASECLDHLGT